VTDGAFPVHLAQALKDRVSSIATCTLLTFQGDEQAKNLLTVSQLGNEALRAGAIRSSVVIGLGGGLAGNVAGPLAGLFLPGARLVQIPTTLLAMSDSCLSLKQGVNSDLGKNHFGLFKQPAFVWADLAYLRELPPREIQSALCELIKNVLALCPHCYGEVAATLRPDGVYATAQIVRFIELCIEAKCSVMRDDALEKHGAVVLEYGHTVGHALEMAAHGAIPHGLAIGMGMVVEACISHRLGMLAQRDVDKPRHGWFTNPGNDIDRESVTISSDKSPFSLNSPARCLFCHSGIGEPTRSIPRMETVLVAMRVYTICPISSGVFGCS